VTYRTPRAESASSPPIARTDVFHTPLLEISCEDVEVTTVFGSSPIVEPSHRKITHPHQLGKLAMNMMGASTNEFSEDFLSRAYKLVVQLHGAVISGGQESWSTPRARQPSSKTPWILVAPSDGGIFTETMKESLVYLVKHLKLCQMVSSFLEQTQEHWDQDWFQLDEEEAVDLRSLGDKLFAPNSLHYAGMAFLDLFVGHTTECPILLKISLGVDVQRGPSCSICDLDVVTIDCVHSEGAVTINIPLPRAGEEMSAREKTSMWTTRQKGEWKSMTSRLRGWEVLATCQRKSKFTPAAEPCLARFDVLFDPGHWDPLATSERPQTFQAHPHEWGHICCNEEECGAEQFQIAPEDRLVFEPVPNDEAVWDPRGEATESLDCL
jgi:hypothetical protein